MKILGIDPGTNVLGYAVLNIDNNLPTLIISGNLNIKHISSPYAKLEKILLKINSLINEYTPDEMAIEAPFYGKNVQSMLKLGRAQGVAIAAAMSKGLKVYEYSPKKIKMAITGNGNATKEQIALMLKSILRINILPETFDETDAIAAALCHFYQGGKIETQNSYSSWKDFISKNPGKLKE